MMALYEVDLDQLAGLVPGVDPAVLEFAEKSSPLIVAMWGDLPTSIVGLIPLTDGVYIWMETLAGTYNHRVATARHSMGLIRRAVAQYGRVVGHCNQESSIRWMEWLGAKVTPGPVSYFEITR